MSEGEDEELESESEDEGGRRRRRRRRRRRMGDCRETANIHDVCIILMLLAGDGSGAEDGDDTGGSLFSSETPTRPHPT